MPHAQSFVTRALKSLGVVAAGETPDADDLNDGFTTLNEMIDAWATDRLVVYTVERVTLTWTAGSATRTIGEGGNFNRVRPMWLRKASVIPNAGTQEIPLYVTEEASEYQRIPLKSTQSTIPQFLYNDKAHPLSNLYLYPVPSVTVTLVAYLPLALVQFADLTTEYDFPPGYARAIRTNLAMELAPDYEIEPSATLRDIAGRSKAEIMIPNAMSEIVPVDEAILSGNGRGGHFDWRTGWSR